MWWSVRLALCHPRTNALSWSVKRNQKVRSRLWSADHLARMWIQFGQQSSDGQNRFRSLLNRFNRQPEFEGGYWKAVQKYFDQDFASRVADHANTRYFLARHGICKERKLHAVYYAAAFFKGKFLNDSIISGPALTRLLAVLTRSREGDIAWASDFKAMFSRFWLSIKDLDFLCFLGQEKNGTKPIVCRMDQLPFGASFLPSLAIYAVRRIVKDTWVEDQRNHNHYGLLICLRSQSPKLNFEFSGIPTWKGKSCRKPIDRYQLLFPPNRSPVKIPKRYLASSFSSDTSPDSIGF